MFSAFSKKLLPSVFGRGVSSFLFLYNLSPNCSGFSGCFLRGIGGMVVGGKLAVILWWFQFCSSAGMSLFVGVDLFTVYLGSAICKSGVCWYSKFSSSRIVRLITKLMIF